MALRLTRDFFARSTLEVAPQLLGKVLVFGDYRGIIIETEAYIGQDDPACHAAKGVTPRTQVMFGPPGFSYVYFIYGMYHCLNIVTEPPGVAAAVLIRGLYLCAPRTVNLDGPGKLCRQLGITRDHNAIDLVTSELFYIEDSSIVLPFMVTPRIGISKAKEKLWRYVADVKAVAIAD
jgi:DNA-3-methyladenine glycosylase